MDGCGVLIVKNGKFLVGDRSDGQGVCGGGGHIEQGETPLFAVKREVGEELGILIDDPKKLGRVIVNGIQSHIFYTDHYYGKPHDTQELLNVRFETFDELKREKLFPHFEKSLILYNKLLGGDMAVYKVKINNRTFNVKASDSSEAVNKVKRKIKDEDKKYEILPNGHIKALKSFTCQWGAIKAGDIGGKVSSEKNLSQQGNCWIFNNAQVIGNAEVKDNAVVCDKAEIRDCAKVHGNALIRHQVKLGGYVDVDGHAEVSGLSVISGNAKVTNLAIVTGYAKISGRAVIKDNAVISGKAQISGNVIVGGKVKINEGTYTKGSFSKQEDLKKFKDSASNLYKVTTKDGRTFNVKAKDSDEARAKVKARIVAEA